MSQSGILNVENSNPQIPTSFQTDSGIAIPIANQLELLGEVVANAGVPFRSIGSGNTVTYQIQYANETPITDATIVGLASFDSSAFDVDNNGYVTLLGGGTATTNIDVDFSSPPGTDPVIPDGSGNIVFSGAQVASGTVGANVLRTASLAANTVIYQIQRAGAAVLSDSTLNGVSHYNSNDFTVVDGFVSLAGSGGLAIDSIGVDSTSGAGTNPVVPDGTGLVTHNGAVIAAGNSPVGTVSTAPNVYQTQVQLSQALAAPDASAVGLCVFDSASFQVDSDGFVTSLSGGMGGVTAWIDVTDESLDTNMTAGYGYFSNDPANSGNFVLPAVAAKGTILEITNLQASQNFTITQAAGQSIQFGNVSSTVGAGGSINSNEIGDSLRMVCIIANTKWQVLSAQGNLNYV